jgi:hypothetical protein
VTRLRSSLRKAGSDLSLAFRASRADCVWGGGGVGGEEGGGGGREPREWVSKEAGEGRGHVW